MKLRRFLAAGMVCAVVLGCTPPPLPSTLPTPREKPAMQVHAGPRSAEELKGLFLRHYRSGDIDAVMALFYLMGASPNTVSLYRCSVPKVDEEPIESAEVKDIAGDHQTDIPHTLKPERLLLLKFREGSPSVERSFYISQHDGRYYFTLPSGD